MVTSLPIHYFLNIKNLMHGTSYIFKNFFWIYIATSNITQYYYREASTLLIQHVCVILAFAIVHPKHTVCSNLNTPVSANPRQSFDS